MYTHKNRFSRMLVMLLALVMVVGTFSGCQKNDLQPLVTELELLAEETMEPTEETEPETSLPDETTEPTVFTEPTEAEEETTEPTEAEDKPHAHVYTTTVVAPTTSTQGYTLHTCKTCGYTYKDNYKDKLPTAGGNNNTGNNADANHTHSYTTTVTPATCTKKGYTTYTCKTCGYSYKANEKPALGHTEEKTVTKPTCTEKGYTTCKCTRCGYSYKTDEVPALGHAWKCWSETNYDGWEAYQNGTAEQHHLDRRDCLRCGKAEFQDLGLGHAPGKLIETVKPTCTKGGYELHECMGFLGNDVGAPQCAEILKTNEVPALGHDWGKWTVTTQPTQNSEGVETRTCSRCNEKETRKIDKLPTEPAKPEHEHKYEVTSTTPASCEKTGKSVYTCSCGASYEKEIPATGHSWGDWVRTQDPTQEAEGIDTRTCSKCNKTETRSVDKLPPETEPAEPEKPTVDYSDSVDVTDEVLEVINRHRADRGLDPLVAGGMVEYTKIRAAEQHILPGHDRPYGPGQDGDYDGSLRFECIGHNWFSAESVVTDGWMKSDAGHRRAIMCPTATKATVARNGNEWVLFIDEWKIWDYEEIWP